MSDFFFDFLKLASGAALDFHQCFAEVSDGEFKAVVSVGEGLDEDAPGIKELAEGNGGRFWCDGGCGFNDFSKAGKQCCVDFVSLCHQASSMGKLPHTGRLNDGNGMAFFKRGIDERLLVPGGGFADEVEVGDGG